jgi:hypothetical protein
MLGALYVMKVLGSEGWDWTEKAFDVAKIKLLCGACYDEAKKFNFPFSEAQ